MSKKFKTLKEMYVAITQDHQPYAFEYLSGEERAVWQKMFDEGAFDEDIDPAFEANRNSDIVNEEQKEDYAKWLARLSPRRRSSRFSNK